MHKRNMILHYLTYICRKKKHRVITVITEIRSMYCIISASSVYNSAFTRKFLIQRWTRQWCLVSVNFHRGRKNPRARPRGNRWEVSPSRLRDNRASSCGTAKILSRNLFWEQKRRENRGELYREMETPGMCVSDARVSSENGQWESVARYVEPP